MARKNNNKAENFEKTLFKAADKLRKNMDAAEYKHIVLGLIFLKYISDSFETLHQKLLDGKYEDVKGFCKSATPEEIKKHNYVLTPGRYVGIKEEEDDGIPFEEKMKHLTSELAEQFEEEGKLNMSIKKNLERLGYGF